MLLFSIGQLTTAAIRGYPNANDRRSQSYPNASDRRSQSYPNANDRRGYPIANGLPTGPA
jgi:hypothetical protein